MRPEKTLIFGFDSAWTVAGSGALVGVSRDASGAYEVILHPQAAAFEEASEQIEAAIAGSGATKTIIMLDQPTVVAAEKGQRPVEHLISSPIGRRYGGVQPCSRAKVDMFGAEAPIWSFLGRFDTAQNPLRSAAIQVLETYPSLALVALDWTLPDKRPGGRLPKYNPDRNSFSMADWRHVSGRLQAEFWTRGLSTLCDSFETAARYERPSKATQDKIDACICLLVGMHVVEDRATVLIGQPRSGYMLVPASDSLLRELRQRCERTKRDPDDWIQLYSLPSH